ncbi:MAG: hypothetical protein ABJO57_14975 [Lentilitoribacter sp.]
MRTFMITMAIFIAHTLIAFADTSEFEGLYYPPGDTTGSWTCSADNLGEYGGALGIKNDIIHGTEWSCQLSSPKQAEEGTQFFGECSAEGTEYRDIITLRKINNGLNVKTPDGELEWRSCVKDAAETSSSSSWVSGYAMGVSETKVSNDKDEAVIFSCGVGTSEPLVSIYFETNNSINGPVALIVDGKAYNFEAAYNAIEMDTECAECMKNYVAFMRTLFNGSTMTVVPNRSVPLTFTTVGASNAFSGEICEDSGYSFKEADVDCTFFVEKRVMHKGKCRMSEDDDIINFFTQSDIEFFIPIHLNDNRVTATGYWNGPTGGNHAHSNLGEMKLVGNCWQNSQNSICYRN